MRSSLPNVKKIRFCFVVCVSTIFISFLLKLKKKNAIGKERRKRPMGTGVKEENSSFEMAEWAAMCSRDVGH